MPFDRIPEGPIRITSGRTEEQQAVRTPHVRQHPQSRWATPAHRQSVPAVRNPDTAVLRMGTGSGRERGRLTGSDGSRVNQPATPTGFVLREVGDRRVYMAADWVVALEQLGFADGEASAQPLGALGGRVPHPVYRLPGTDESVLWKHCQRGGFMQHVLADRYRSTARFLRELVLCREARARGVRVADTIGLAIEHTPAGFKRVEMVTRMVDDARDLADALAVAALSAEDRRQLLRAIGTELRRFHGHGFLHGDLNVKNILWRAAGRDAAGGYEVYLIDIDPRDERLPGQSPGHNLLRLYRSYFKGERRGDWQLSLTDLYGFLDAYFGSDRAAARGLWQRGRRRRARWELFGGPRRLPDARGTLAGGGPAR